MTETLSPNEARKLVLLSQRLPPGRQVRSALAATQSAIEHLGYVQIDTISVVERAHHHTLWNRNPRYRAAHLDQLLEDKRVFEYWSHAASYMPMRDFRFSLPRKRAIASGEQEHWFDRDARVEKFVIERIASEGPLMAKDFDDRVTRKGGWGTKPAKRALENLFMEGKLMSSRRIKFQKVYDLTERVLPPDTATDQPTREEHARHLIRRYLRANGLGRPAEVAYLLKGAKASIADSMEDMVSGGELIRVRVQGQAEYALPDSLEILDRPLARSRVKILSPFDNLVIQRERMRRLFGFDYLVECYVPAAKRRFGYFVLPILWNGRLAARMDCKAERRRSLLHIHHLALEPWLRKTEAFVRALGKELIPFMRFNGCSAVHVHGTSPKEIRSTLQAELRDGG